MSQRSPNSFQRWVADHPWLWILILIAFGATIAFGSFTDGSSIELALLFIGGCAIAGGAGALLARVRVRRFDADAH